jgi:dsRNA-specific ribonuclease
LNAFSKIHGLKEKFPKLLHIDLSNNKITTVSIEALANIARQLNNLKGITLSNTEMTDTELSVIVDVFDSFDSLALIDLS